MLLFLFFLFLIGWILGFVVFKVSAFAIHVLLILALVWLILHLDGRRTAQDDHVATAGPTRNEESRRKIRRSADHSCRWVAWKMHFSRCG